MHAIGAYLFVKRFLAHATDGQVSEPEWHAINQPPQTLAGLRGPSVKPWPEHVEEATATYNALLEETGAGGVVREFHRCVAVVREAFGDAPDVRADLLASCQALVAADGTVDPMEAHFLSQVAHAWSATMASGQARLDLVEAYLFVTRFIAEATDEHLDEREWDHIRSRLVQHGAALGATPVRCRDALTAASSRYRRLRAAGPDAVLVHFRECIEALHLALPPDGNAREVLLLELWQLAAADGIILDEERAVLEGLEAAWLRRD